MVLKNNLDGQLFLDEDEEFLFAAETEEHDAIGIKETWKVLIVDDEEEVHRVTKMVLADLHFEGKGISILSAYSGEQAMEMMKEHQDVAVVLLDVVMETDDAGLKAVEFIRSQLKNSTVRIILRTGQPGQAPEKRVIVDYDINDYKEKTEMTSQKLFTTTISLLRSYRDLKIIENNKKGLEDIIKSSTNILKIQSTKKLAEDVLKQLSSILELQAGFGGLTISDGASRSILASIGSLHHCLEDNLNETLTKDVLLQIETVFTEKRSFFLDSSLYIYLQSQSGVENVIYLETGRDVTEWDRYLAEVYCSTVTVAFENIYLNEEIEKTQREIIFTLGEIAETRSKETGYHVKRVAEYSKLLALKYGLSEEESELIRLASPMHDVGKVGISDDILNKPGKLTFEEYEIMKTHAQAGYDMLKHSCRPIMKAAAIISLQHHEKYNGAGYPNGLSGEDIHLYGRITAIADVFDALASDRVYKKAWEMERIVQLFKEERGEHFDPHLTDLFLAHFNDFLAIKDKYADIKVF